MTIRRALDEAADDMADDDNADSVIERAVLDSCLRGESTARLTDAQCGILFAEMSKPLAAALNAITAEPGTERNERNLLTSVGRVANYIRHSEASHGFLPSNYSAILRTAVATADSSSSLQAATDGESSEAAGLQLLTEAAASTTEPTLATDARTDGLPLDSPERPVLARPNLCDAHVAAKPIAGYSADDVDDAMIDEWLVNSHLRNPERVQG
jgi:hypothetical protein